MTDLSQMLNSLSVKLESLENKYTDLITSFSENSQPKPDTLSGLISICKDTIVEIYRREIDQSMLFGVEMEVNEAFSQLSQGIHNLKGGKHMPNQKINEIDKQCQDFRRQVNIIKKKISSPIQRNRSPSTIMMAKTKTKQYSPVRTGNKTPDLQLLKENSPSRPVSPIPKTENYQRRYQFLCNQIKIVVQTCKYENANSLMKELASIQFEEPKIRMYFQEFVGMIPGRAWLLQQLQGLEMHYKKILQDIVLQLAYKENQLNTLQTKMEVYLQDQLKTMLNVDELIGGDDSFNRHQLEATESALEELTVEIQKKDEEIERLKKENSQLGSFLQRIESIENETKQYAAQSQKFNQLKAENIQLKEQLSAKEGIIKELENNFSDYNSSELSRLQGEVERLNRDLCGKRAETKRSQELIEKLKASKQLLETRNKELTVKVSEIEKKLSNIRSSQSKKAAELANSRSEQEGIIADLREKLKSATIKADQDGDKFLSLQEKYNQLKYQTTIEINTLKEEVQVLRNLNENLEETLSSSQTTLEEWKQYIINIQNDRDQVCKESELRAKKHDEELYRLTQTLGQFFNQDLQTSIQCLVKTAGSIQEVKEKEIYDSPPRTKPFMKRIELPQLDVDPSSSVNQLLTLIEQSEFVKTLQ